MNVSTFDIERLAEFLENEEKTSKKPLKAKESDESIEIANISEKTNVNR